MYGADEPSTGSSPVPTAAIEERVDLILDRIDRNASLRAVLVHRGGEPVYERYISCGPEDYWDIRSVTKSVVGTLVGIAIDHGLISDTTATLGELLPRWVGDLTAETSQIPLSAVLTHTADFADDIQAKRAGAWSSLDPVATALTDRAARGAGDGSFRYSDAGSHILAAVVAEASGMPVLEFARMYLFDPLGVVSEPAFDETTPVPAAQLKAALRAYNDADFAWPKDGRGVHTGSSALKLRPSDLARLGQLYLDRGVWGGEQLVSETWIEQATAPQVDTDGGLRPRYGYQWWVAGDAANYSAMGMGGTLVCVHPVHRLVIVVANQIDAEDGLARHAMGLGNALHLAETILDVFESTV